MMSFSKTYRVVWLEFFVPKQCFFVIACNRKQPIGEGSWNKEISSFFSFLWQDKICLMRYSRQALFPPSTRATLKSFGDVFAKSCYQCRSKRDGTLGIASAGFQVIRQHCKDSLLKEQRIRLLLI